MSTSPGRKSPVFAAVLPVLTVLDVFTLPSLSVSALLVRLLWGVELVGSCLLFERCSETWRRVLLLLNSFFSLALVHVTGGLASPYVHLVPTLPLLVAFNLSGGVGLGRGQRGGVRAGHRSGGAPPLEQAAGWVSALGSATFFGVFGSALFRKAAAARSESRVERALAELQRAQSERLATVGRLAASVMHEINNPLAFVRANLQSREGWSPGPESEVPRERVAHTR